MKYYSQYLSYDLFELQHSLSGLSKTNCWVKLADRLPWNKIEKEYNKHLSDEHGGAGNKPARMVVGAMIVRHVENLSDEKTILAIQENPYMQYFCGLSAFTSRRIFSPSLLTSLHERISEDEIHLLVERAKRRARARSYYRRRKAAAADRQETPAQQTAE